VVELQESPKKIHGEREPHCIGYGRMCQGSVAFSAESRADSEDEAIEGEGGLNTLSPIIVEAENGCI